MMRSRSTRAYLGEEHFRERREQVQRPRDWKELRVGLRTLQKVHMARIFVKVEMDGSGEVAKGHVHLSGEGVVWGMRSSLGRYPCRT